MLHSATASTARTLLCQFAAAPALLSLSRASSFSSLTSNFEQWQAKASKELKGRDPLTTLTHHTQDVSWFAFERATQQMQM